MIVYRELSSLVQDLGFSAKTLYAVSNTIGQHYRPVQLPKPGGGSRALLVPDHQLKAIQRQIARVLLVHMPISPHATAYRYGGSTLKNAAPHVGQPMVLKLDILHFFDSILYSSVKACAFPPEIYAEPLRVLLTMLCYAGDRLPQGAPSSPAITNILMAGFDEEVAAWCSRRGIRYTRYCDDMTFSGDFSPEEVIPFVAAQLRRQGFFLNGGKTRCLPAGQRQVVTGLTVNDKLGLPVQDRRQLRQELYFCQKFGLQSQMAHRGIPGGEAHYAWHLLGRVGYALQLYPGDRQLLQARAWLLQALSGSGREDRPTGS